jgi:hypothetical protein
MADDIQLIDSFGATRIIRAREVSNRLVQVTETNPASGATGNRVAASTAPVTLFAANAFRRTAFGENESPQEMRIKYGAGATPTDYTFRVPAGELWEMPSPPFQGELSGCWLPAEGGGAPTSAVQMTEVL